MIAKAKIIASCRTNLPSRRPGHIGRIDSGFADLSYIKRTFRPVTAWPRPEVTPQCLTLYWHERWRIGTRDAGRWRGIELTVHRAVGIGRYWRTADSWGTLALF